MVCRRFSVALCCLAFSGCVGINQGSRPMGSIIGQTKPAPQPGDWCRITLPAQQTGWMRVEQQHLTGQVEDVSQDGLRLSQVRSQQQSRVPVVGRIPWMGRIFQQTAEGQPTGELITSDEIERLEIISRTEAGQPSSQLVAQRLAAAVPGMQRLH